jgi:hypothetical protein
MREIFKYGSVGRALGDQCLYPESIKYLTPSRVFFTENGLRRISPYPLQNMTMWSFLA